jgi:hypothetical protein
LPSQYWRTSEVLPTFSSPATMTFKTGISLTEILYP